MSACAALEKASRSQRLFVAAAKQLAGLAKVPEKVAQAIDDSLPLTQQDKDVATGSQDTKADAFTQLLTLGADAKVLDDEELEKELLMDEPGSSEVDLSKPIRPSSNTSRASSISSTSTMETDYTTDIGRMHVNMRDRLRAFFSQKLEGRHVRISIHLAGERDDAEHPLARGTLLTGEGGGFRQSINFPTADKVKFGDTLKVVAELLMDPDADVPTVEGPHYREDEVFVTIANAGVPRVISDLDDTCKVRRGRLCPPCVSS